MPFIDTDVLFALLKPNDWLHDAALKAIKTSGLYTSSLVFVELAVVVRRELNEAISTRLPEVLPVPIKVVNFSMNAFNKSSELRDNYNLGIFDAAHAATALENDGSIISSDAAFDRVKELKRIPLE